MRVTNQMMSNNALSNINKNKIALSKLEEQYSTNKKIQKPSDDPVVAVRALKLRKNLSELNQYYEKNIPDAKSWMEITESALKNVTDICTSINGYANQGATDTLTADNRASVLKNIQQLVSQIYEEGNSNCAGRYVFTGYKTDTGLLFDQDTNNKKYTITQEFKGTDISSSERVIGGYTVDDYTNPAAGTTPSVGTFSTAPVSQSVYTMNLGYNDLDGTAGSVKIGYTYKNAGGTDVTVNIDPTKINIVSVSDKNAYSAADDGINFIKETGELVIGKTVHETMKLATDIKVDYQKSEFSKGDVKPEMYYDCVMEQHVGAVASTAVEKTITYEKKSQNISYDINFNQSLVVNTEASDAIPMDLKRQVDIVAKAIQDVDKVESDITEVKKMLEDTSTTDAQKKVLEALQSQLETELSLKTSIMQKEFGNTLTATSNQQQAANLAVADLGSRYVRLEMTEERLSTQQTDFEDLLSTNEDADMVETIVKYNSQSTIYNASLSAAAKIAKNSLLDFI
ncbi:flagellar hook-associated protein FlgL [Lachnospiraceae bacterium KM106-2]|nr:flagellar hook-associated protein FlgL [Lachnospiraceae bacterium KM106-2]